MDKLSRLCAIHFAQLLELSLYNVFTLHGGEGGRLLMRRQEFETTVVELGSVQSGFEGIMSTDSCIEFRG